MIKRLIFPRVATKFDAAASLGYSRYAGWSSLVARRAHNPKVVSSNLTPATMGAYEENPLSALLASIATTTVVQLLRS